MTLHHPVTCSIRREPGFRRRATEVRIGSTHIGGSHPILVQSMTTTLTRDIKATVAQTIALARIGCGLVRITTPTAADAACLEHIMREVRGAGFQVPVCADIHFQPAAAFEAVKWVDKVRINPGNFADARTPGGHEKEFDDQAYERGLQRINDKFRPLVRMARERGVSLRIGTNHGSLSDRILARWGDTPEGMVVSALEYLRICVEEAFDQIVFSMKSSNPKVVVQCNRLLVRRLEEQGHLPYPLHLGVTEAGEGRDGRLKSAVGIGTLLLDGLGDTVRVSLTEDPLAEIPVALDLVAACGRPLPPDDPGLPLDFSGRPCAPPEVLDPVDPFSFSRRRSLPLQIPTGLAGEGSAVRVGGVSEIDLKRSGRAAEWYEVPVAIEVDHLDDPALKSPPFLSGAGAAAVVHLESCGPWLARRTAAVLDAHGQPLPLVLSWRLDGTSRDELRMAATLGSLLCDGLGDLVRLQNAHGSANIDLAWDVLQAAGSRRSKAEFVSCPSCGRTLFDLVTTSARIRERTWHLDDVSIAIMGCIVNGPGEMADADFGYVGGAPDTVNLYVGRTCVRKGIPTDQAPQALVDLIAAHGRWKEPPAVSEAS